MLFGLLVFAAIVLVLFWFVTTYNGLVEASEKATRAWNDLDVLLRQRHDELPKVIEMCEPHMPSERPSFERLLATREAALAARQARDADALGRAERTLQTGISDVLDRAARHLELAATPAFGLLRQRHATLDAEIAAGRERYNETVREYNAAARRAPGNLVALVGQFPRLRPLAFEPASSLIA